MTEDRRQARAGPLVSVLIATHNRPQMLEAAVESVHGQTYPFLETIVVNDHPASSDAVDAVASRARRRLRVIHNKENLGPSATRNIAIAAASGSILAPLDDDDLWEPEFLTRHVAAHMTDDAVSVVYSGYLADASESGLRPRVVPAQAPPDNLFSKMASGEFTLASSSIVTLKAKFLASTGVYDPGLKGFEDWDLLLRLARVGPFSHIPEALTVYRLHGGDRVSATRTGLDSVVSKWREFPEVRLFALRMQAEAEFAAGRTAGLSGDRVAALTHLVRYARVAKLQGVTVKNLAILVALGTLGPRAYRRIQSAVRLSSPSGQAGRRP